MQRDADLDALVVDDIQQRMIVRIGLRILKRDVLNPARHLVQIAQRELPPPELRVPADAGEELVDGGHGWPRCSTARRLIEPTEGRWQLWGAVSFSYALYKAPLFTPTPL